MWADFFKEIWGLKILIALELLDALVFKIFILMELLLKY